MANAERLQRVLTYIEQHPEEWKQSEWHCGSSHCFCGMAQILAGHPANGGKLCAQAREWLDLSRCEFDRLAYVSNTLEDLRRIVGGLVAGYDGNGYDGNGYDRDGRDRDGRDRDGCDRAGRDRYGCYGYSYDRDGYNRAGYDRDGYDRAGYNRDGYNRDGCDRRNCDRNGYLGDFFSRRYRFDRDGYDDDGLDINNKSRPAVVAG